MNELQVSTYADYLDYLTLEALREEAKGIDHDCKSSFDDDCRVCELIENADRDVLIQIILENGKE